MTPIKIIKDGRLTLTLDPFAFIVNSFALGDVVATAPVIKYMLDNYYVTPESHLVVAKQVFRPLFPFVADSNFIDFDRSPWNIAPRTPMGMLNKKVDGTFVRNTPKSMHLSHYASLAFADQIVDLEDLSYVAVPRVDISHYGVDFSKAVILVTTYRDTTRMWYVDEILKTAAWIKSQGLVPVFIGKLDNDEGLKAEQLAKTSLPSDVSEYGVDLRNKTSLQQLASIMAASKAVCGVDSGPIHLAGTTTTPIVVGYSTVDPKYRIPTRKDGQTYVIQPSIECGGCESRWRTSYWNFANCYFGHANCCKEFTADKFICGLEAVLEA